MNGVGGTGPVGPLRPSGERPRLDAAREGAVPRGTPSFSRAQPDPATKPGTSAEEFRAVVRSAAAQGLTGPELAEATAAGALERAFGAAVPQRLRESVARDLGQDPAFQALVERLARGEAATP